MTRKIVAVFTALLLMLTLAACGKEAAETTLTGMVVSVEGTNISLMEMEGNMGGRNFGGGSESGRPQMPEGMEGFEGLENFDPETFQGFGGFAPEDFQGSMPEGGSFPQWDGELPEGMTIPEGMTMPQGGQMPDFGDMNLEDYLGDGETRTVDVGDAHISVEIDGGKASGSMEDIKAGTFVTVTLNGKGEVTNVLVSSRSGLGGSRQPVN